MGDKKLTKPITRICCDCGARVKNRSVSTKRCRACYHAALAGKAHGRLTAACSTCGCKLSQKKNLTGLCGPCHKASPSYAHPMTGRSLTPWNKGKTRFLGPDDARAQKAALRRALRNGQSPDASIGDRIRTLIRNSLRRASVRKDTKTATLLGCSVVEFKAHLERQFMSGMAWENYGNGPGRWSIDHLMPLAAFDLSVRANQLAAFHYENCRPLWSIENSAKGCRLPEPITFGRTH